MDYNAQLKLQAWLDGELPEAEAHEVAAEVAGDRDGAALADELRHTRQALAGFAADVRLPESREFYWSKIAREIQRLEAAPPEPAAQDFSFAVLFRRWLVPASAVAVLVLGSLLLTRPPAPSGAAAVESETALADGGAFTYRDDSAGTTLVWLSYPADNDIADGSKPATVN